MRGRDEADPAIAQSDVASHGVRGEAMFLAVGKQPVDAILGLHSEDALVIIRRDLNHPSPGRLPHIGTLPPDGDGPAPLDS